MTFPDTQSRSIAADVRLLYAARGLRGFGDGFAIIILPAYLTAIGYSPLQIGIVATAALLGSAVLTLAVGFFAPRHDLRNLLLAGAALVALTGLAFPLSEHIALVLAVAFFGTINPSAATPACSCRSSTRCWRAASPTAGRTAAFARYSLTGALAGAAGSLAAATPDALALAGIAQVDGVQADVPRLRGARARQRRALPPPAACRDAGGALLPARALAQHGLQAGRAVQPRLVRRRPRRAIDAGAVAVRALRALAFGREPVLLLVGHARAPSPFRSRPGSRKRIGLVNTMVFTHIPSSIFLILAVFAPNLIVALALLLARAALSQMDVPTRTSYVMAVVTPAERTAAASVTAVPRSLASSISPVLTGALLATPAAGLPFIACGVLKIVYDIALLYSFRHVKPPEERADG